MPLADVTIHLSYPLAFLAGVVCFISPCVFPLVPAYVAYLGGRSAEQIPAIVGAGGSEASAGVALAPPLRRQRAPVLANGGAFVVGFSTVFIAFYYVLRALDITVLVQHRQTVNVVGGIIVILLALQTLGVLRIGWLMRERRIHLVPGQPGLLPSWLLGVTFAAGWTPCIGPQLAGILTVAQQRDFIGLPVMVIYCLGLAVPFMLVAAAADRLQGRLRSLNRHLGVVNLVAGAVLLVFGLLLLTDQFTYFNRYVNQSPFDL